MSIRREYVRFQSEILPTLRGLEVDPLDVLNMHCWPPLCHPSYIPLKVCVLVVQISPWHVPWLSPLLQLVS